jgi:hypothetical protein
MTMSAMLARRSWHKQGAEMTKRHAFCEVCFTFIDSKCVYRAAMCIDAPQ